MRDMKESGVAWLGTIPKEYKTVPIGSLFTIKKDIIGQEPDTVLSITQTGVKPKDLSSNEGQNASSYAHYQKVCVGDFAMNHMDLLTGWVDISKYEGVTSPDYRVFSLNDARYSADYFLRVFQYYYANKIFFGFGQGVATLGRWRLPAVNFNKIDVPIPPPSEQHRIVKELNTKTEKIEELKQNVKGQIEKLKQYKQSLITEVVTRGLDSAAQMKNSGVEWIESIPEAWQISPLKSLFSFGKGLPITKENLTETGIPVISYGQIHAKWNTGVTTHAELYRFVSEKYLEANPDSLVQKGDVIMADTSEDKEGCGNCAYIDTDDTVFAGYHTIILKSLTKTNTKYLAYLFLTDHWRSQLRKQVSGVKLFSVSKRILGSTTVLIPDCADEIVAYLDDKCSQIDALIRIKQAKIAKLEKYKKSIIYEYVTGKKEVQ